MAEKALVRAGLLAARRAMAAGPRAAADAALIHHLVGTATRLGTVSLAGYVPMAGEPGGPDLLATLARAVPTILVPVVLTDMDLDWARYDGPASLTAPGRAAPGGPGALPGLRQPTGPRLGPAAITAADLIIVPAVGVDATGRRLGRGGGSYDRALARVGPHVLVVAMIYDGELVEELPAEAHDRPVGAVITPTGGLRLMPPGVDRDTKTGR